MHSETDRSALHPLLKDIFVVELTQIPFLVTKRGKKKFKKIDKKISSFTSETLFQHDFYFTKFKTMNFDNFFTNDRFPVFFSDFVTDPFLDFITDFTMDSKKVNFPVLV